MTEYQLRLLIWDALNNDPEFRKLAITTRMAKSLADTAIRFAVKDELIELGPDIN